ncbi:DUF4037 domain-containing protein [Fictibacillus fluitans]|uniref:DUF4037 domain-containing protein n=1 Tax=Fictibacillus fluitans TaxID=3058422 RepID=A0ABT8I3J5_9BACL|nr:DUF4037 domain-containing protein [Fictibacillus sp. NE201]MDN4527556.1 DUF4037 domain-containing protein [Fictibacillus sp. NE201]
MQSLFKRARQMAEVYQKNENIAGVLLGGSVSRGWNDSHSDIELHILWKIPPGDRDRLCPIEEVHGEIIDFHPYEEEEWAETYIVDGVKFEISGFLVRTMQEVIQQVVKQANTNYDLQCLAASIKDGKILFEDEGTLSVLKEEVKSYPKALSENMILENLELGSRWNNRSALLARKDWLMYYDVMTAVQKRMLGILFGLNGVYVHHPAFKWLNQSIGEMIIVPDRLYERFTEVLTGEPEVGLAVLEEVVEEVFTLVGRHSPHLPVEEKRKQAAFRRPEHF